MAGTAVPAIRNATGYLHQIVSQPNRMCEESLYLTGMNNSINLGAQHAIPDHGAGVEGQGAEVVLHGVTFRYPRRRA
ncbi:hypothetical protein Q3V23_34685 [Streptomyces sp. VNUA116]|uniref:hypothetical protein n=1 Tax=Streptomyces sp. VNUA116 TaxID=3062449 RepID=UPI0026756090|nr:hypothetical protein [Streptomyces sp. VNUA116]WKU48793.1 hypothetical protein Q3V23_34685 [Streptomyces sp. VNUA116]